MVNTSFGAIFVLVRLQSMPHQENGQFSLTENASGFPSVQIDPDISNHNEPFWSLKTLIEMLTMFMQAH